MGDEQPVLGHFQRGGLAPIFGIIVRHREERGVPIRTMWLMRLGLPIRLGVYPASSANVQICLRGSSCRTRAGNAG